MKKTKRLFVLLTAVLLIFTACTGAGQPPPDKSESSAAQSDPSGGVLPGVTAENYPRIDGSTSNMPLMAKLYSEICGVSLEDAETMVEVSTTGGAWRSMLYESADLLLVYEMAESIRAELEEANVLEGLEIIPVARDGLVFLVNAENPVDSLTREQLVGIYTGAVTDWSEVGGESGPITAFQRNDGSGSQTMFLALLMQDAEPMEPPGELVPAAMGALIDAVAEFDGSGGAIGYSVYYYAGLMDANPDLKLLAVDGVEPSVESIGNGSYPLVNDFYVVIRKGEPESSPARLLRDWLLTDEGRQLIRDADYVPASQAQ